MSVFGERLKAAREMRGLSCPQLADQAGVDRSGIYNYENKHSLWPTSYNLVLIADVLNVSTDYLLGRTDKPGE